jgi:uncharacterized integral membrane protein
MAEGGGDPGRGRDGLDERQVRQIGLIGLVVLAATLLLIFVVENSRQVRVSFVFFSAEISLIWVILLSAVAGALAALALSRTARRRLKDRE